MDDLYTKIEQYLRNELEKEELESFEQQLKVDKELAAEVQLYKELKTGISGRARFENNKATFQGQLKNLGEEFFDQPKATPKRISIFKRRYVLASVLTAAAVLALLLWQPWQTSLYHQYAQHPQMALTERSSITQLDLASTETAFNRGAYSEALNGLESYLKTDPGNPEIQLFTGICHLELKQFEQAKSLFTQLHQGNSAFKDLGSWYLALSHVHQKNPKDAILILQQIPEASDQYQQAQELMRNLSQ